MVRSIMDDASRGMRRGKPPQQLYRPGSGPLKKSPMGPDEESGKQEFPNETPRRGHGRNRHRGHNSNKDSNRFNDDLSDRNSNSNTSHSDSSKTSFQHRKNDQQNYPPKFSSKSDDYRSPSPHRRPEVESKTISNSRYDDSHSAYGDGQNNHEVRSKRYSGNRRQGHDGEDPSRRDGDFRRTGDGRQNSEPRNMSPPRKPMMENQPPRGRDTRSMDSSRHIHHSNGSKPPSGRRGSALNLDLLPPRFRKKYLAESGQLGLDTNSQGPRDVNNYQGSFYGPPHMPLPWSQTLPTRGRGRLREEDVDREKLKHSMNTYLQNFESGSDSRSSTPHATSGPPHGGGRSQFTGSQDNIYLDTFSNYPQNKQMRNDDYSNFSQGYRSQTNQQNDFNNRNNSEHLTHESRPWLPKAEGIENNHNRIPVQNPSPTSLVSDVSSSNRLLESITSSIKNLTVECQNTEKFDWSKESEKAIDHSINLDSKEVQESLSGNQLRNQDQRQYADGKSKSVGSNDVHNKSGGNNHRNVDSKDKGVPPGNLDGGNRQSQGREHKEGRSGRGPRRRKRSSSRGSQRRELSSEMVHRRSERSPHSQGPQREFRDHYRDSKEPHQNVNHREIPDKDYRDSRSAGPQYHRNDYDEMDRPPSRNNWNRSQYSRENSRDRYSYSRASSGERMGGGGSRGGSRERPLPLHLSQHPRGGPGGKLDPEGFRLPPPPPPNPRNSRNQNRLDSWSARGSRHGSVESGCGGDLSPPSVRGGGGGGGGVGGGGGRRRRRKDSDRHAGSTPAPTTNWRDEMQQIQQSDKREPDMRRTQGGSVSMERSHDITSTGKGLAPGILVLPHETTPDRNRNMDMAMDYHQNRGNSQANTNNTSPQSQTVQRTLYNPSNPSKPIVVSQSVAPPSRGPPSHMGPVPPEPPGGGRPAYYDFNSSSFKSCHHRDLLVEVKIVDEQLQLIFKNGTILRDWDKIVHIRPFLQQVLKTLLSTDLKFCEAESVEHHFWKMLYYSYIELMRKAIVQDESNKSQYRELINTIIKDGNTYLESILELLQVTYKFKLEDYLNINYKNAPKATGFVNLALISAQKIYLFLGDLARYKELVNETTNYAKSKSWYTKAHQINPKNGRPYNQLAILAVYARRKLDAVYFYMRSLMSSTPCHSAQESLNALFDENRKKYEANERKRQAERQKAIESTGTPVTAIGGKGSLRRELWTRAGRTTTLLQPEKPDEHSDEEELANMTSVELNKRFVISYLHVHGKLITKIGMETFSSSAGVMLRQFRALLRHSPLPISCGRLLQLTALNMFAIDSAHIKESSQHPGDLSGCRRALAVTLRMFGALLGRCCALLAIPPAPNQPLPVHEDVLVILPALKVWSDWMLYHSSVWNPPPSSDDFDAGADSDPWEQIAKLMNLLEPLDLQSNLLKEEPAEDHDLVRLPEDTQLSGFTPLMYGAPTAWYAPRILEPEAAQLAARASALLFLGTTFLCGTDPPALERRLSPTGIPEYVSVIQHRPSGSDMDRRNSTADSDIMEASLSEEDDGVTDENKIGEVPPLIDWAACVEEAGNMNDGAEDETTRKLLRRRGELETRRQDLERRKLRMQSLLKQGQVSVELEVRPRYLVPDTNCFIDHLPLLQRLLSADANSPYTLVVPLVVVSELEGLTRAARVAEDARAALGALRARRPALRFATTRGSLLVSPTFTAERDGDEQLTNDDKILAASLSLCKALASEDGKSAESSMAADGVRRLIREVVLLTEDRNLRVKALSRELPVRDLPAFMRWAALD